MAAFFHGILGLLKWVVGAVFVLLVVALLAKHDQLGAASAVVLNLVSIPYVILTEVVVPIVQAAVKGGGLF